MTLGKITPIKKISELPKAVHDKALIMLPDGVNSVVEFKTIARHYLAEELKIGNDQELGRAIRKKLK